MDFNRERIALAEPGTDPVSALALGLIVHHPVEGVAAWRRKRRPRTYQCHGQRAKSDELHIANYPSGGQN